MRSKSASQAIVVTVLVLALYVVSLGILLLVSSQRADLGTVEAPATGRSPNPTRPKPTTALFQPRVPSPPSSPIRRALGAPTMVTTGTSEAATHAGELTATSEVAALVDEPTLTSVPTTPPTPTAQPSATLAPPAPRPTATTQPFAPPTPTTPPPTATRRLVPKIATSVPPTATAKPTKTATPPTRSLQATTTETKLTLARGARGPEVEELQRRLNRWLATAPSTKLPPLVVDGVFGARTEAAVRAFESAMGLDGDGIVEPKTWEQLPRE